MDHNQLLAISPVDGRYRRMSGDLYLYFSEFGLFKYRIQVEIEYLIFLSSIPLPQVPEFDIDTVQRLRDLYQGFTVKDAARIKEIERATNHDVKAVEYFIKEKLARTDGNGFLEFVHFALTSQDINNTAVPLLLKEGFNDIVRPALLRIEEKLEENSVMWDTIPMLARTHGQPASPTRLGKEIRVFLERIRNQLRLLESIPLTAKFGGASGGLNAHYAAYPDHDWDLLADQFVASFGLIRSKPTTQIDHYDNMAAFFDGLKRINTVLIDMCRDIWHYISIEYFRQKIAENEVGSSTMPHKVNPIDFENAEGNLAYANAIFEFLSAKLPVSRLQRDLTDSTVLRNVGVPVAHSFIAYLSILKGLNKLELNLPAIEADLERNWVVIAEGIQTILRREGFPEPYEALKKFTRNNKKITRETIHQFVDSLEISDELKKELKLLTPFNYTGRG